MGRYQWVVSFNTGASPLIVDFGFINSSGFSADPHFSH
jgi:gamma-glutamylcysteine synthetase